MITAFVLAGIVAIYFAGLACWYFVFGTAVGRATEKRDRKILRRVSLAGPIWPAASVVLLLIGFVYLVLQLIGLPAQMYQSLYTRSVERQEELRKRKLAADRAKAAA